MQSDLLNDNPLPTWPEEPPCANQPRWVSPGERFFTWVLLGAVIVAAVLGWYEDHTLVDAIGSAGVTAALGLGLGGLASLANRL